MVDLFLAETLNRKPSMVMHNPPHRGAIIREFCIEPLRLTVTEAAKGPGVSRKTLSAFLNGRFGISPETAIRLSVIPSDMIAELPRIFSERTWD